VLDPVGGPTKEASWPAMRKGIVVSQEFALADAAQAHRLGESGKARGKMILHVGASSR